MTSFPVYDLGNGKITIEHHKEVEVALSEYDKVTYAQQPLAKLSA